MKPDPVPPTDSETPDDPELPITPDVVARLVSSHREFLAFVARRVGDRAIAEDILQEAFVRGLDRVGGLRNEESAVRWFYRILRNAVTDYYRRQASAGRGLEAFAAELEEGVEPDEEMEETICRCVSELARTLRPAYAEALQRVEVDSVPVKAYAVEAGISDSNAGVRVFRAREALRKQVIRSCGTCADHGCIDCNCGRSSR